LEVAKEAFTRFGANASLDDIARQAGRARVRKSPQNEAFGSADAGVSDAPQLLERLDAEKPQGTQMVGHRAGIASAR
jgi:hypothetical protein